MTAPAWLTFLWPYLASFGGAVLGMGFAGELSRKGRLWTFSAGLFCALFAGPALHEMFFARHGPNSAIPAFVNFATGALALAVLPIIIRKARDWAESHQLLREPRK